MTDTCPFAKQLPFPPDHYWPGPFTKSQIILHVTQGSTSDGAITWLKKIKLSVQFMIDRDGTILQFTPISAGAWHASKINKQSIGIEHVAMTNGTFPITPEQKASSAKLVAWLSQEFNIPLDREHVLAHNEAAPWDHHVLCCIPTLSPDEIVKLAIDKLSPATL